MTKLQAVNEVLEAIGVTPATALDTNGTSIEGEAETTLDRIIERVQHRPWACNEKKKVALQYADRSLAMTGSPSAAFTFDEILTEATTGATGRFKYLDGTTVYLRWVSGTFETGGTDRVLTGGTSGSTYSSTGLATTITSSKIATDTSWLKVRPHESEPVNFAVRSAGFIYDRDDNTETFDADVYADIVTELAWTDITPALQAYIVALARIQFEKFKNAGAQTNALLLQELTEAKVKAFQEDGDFRRTNLNETTHARAMTGNRRSYA